ncbi:hypothetical protein NPX13_g7867 [Xylaria arbuscula]|uniref:Uncharacterized protein n=1 Tax=Xylaria arbuscula TaxID=114810 RepID=A0A9W8N983_9PEZI|nr:hypothetical protein NPX13_g7867 [Xylaria arbuscula]
MAGRRTKVPDAWDDDDWEVKADKAATAAPEPEVEAGSQAPMTRAERLAHHTESNKRLWQSACALRTSSDDRVQARRQGP